MENELSGAAAQRLYVHRVRLDPTCFSAHYEAQLWAAERSAPILLVVHYGGVSLFIRERKAHPHGQSGRLGEATAGLHGLISMHLKAWGCPPHS